MNKLQQAKKFYYDMNEIEPPQLSAHNYIKQLEKITQWISVKDRLPELYQEVVVFYPPNDYDGGCKEVVTYYDNWREAEYPDSISHWYPLLEDPVIEEVIK